MLKIKDNVDLKELEKFGAKYNYETETYDFYDGSFYVWINTREIAIEVSFDVDENEIMSTLFDLIQAGFVEKVVE